MTSEIHETTHLAGGCFGDAQNLLNTAKRGFTSNAIYS